MVERGVSQSVSNGGDSFVLDIHSRKCVSKTNGVVWTRIPQIIVHPCVCLIENNVFCIRGYPHITFAHVLGCAYFIRPFALRICHHINYVLAAIVTAAAATAAAHTHTTGLLALRNGRLSGVCVCVFVCVCNNTKIDKSYWKYWWQQNLCRLVPCDLSIRVNRRRRRDVCIPILKCQPNLNHKHHRPTPTDRPVHCTHVYDRIHRNAFGGGIERNRERAKKGWPKRLRVD